MFIERDLESRAKLWFTHKDIQAITGMQLSGWKDAVAMHKVGSSFTRNSLRRGDFTFCLVS